MLLERLNSVTDQPDGANNLPTDEANEKLNKRYPRQRNYALILAAWMVIVNQIKVVIIQRNLHQRKAQLEGKGMHLI